MYFRSDRTVDVAQPNGSPPHRRSESQRDSTANTQRIQPFAGGAGCYRKQYDLLVRRISSTKARAIPSRAVGLQ